ncbi:hypothetical protein EOL96_01000 [Candidatus Saccharibacteria bacterium]|nr:hypothetical protein [Candidatus Saccharibacteria bacterium]
MYKVLVIIIATVVMFTGSVVRAEDQSSLLLTNPEIEIIRANCTSVQSTLNRINASDALARVSLGQRYEIIATKLMAPLNSRIALNRLDNVELTKTTAEFNATLAEFRTAYQQYEQTMIRAIELSCKDRPVAFYDTIILARNHRASVHELVVKLGVLMTQYGSQFDAFQDSVLENKKEPNNE